MLFFFAFVMTKVGSVVAWRLEVDRQPIIFAGGLPPRVRGTPWPPTPPSTDAGERGGGVGGPRVPAPPGGAAAAGGGGEGGRGDRVGRGVLPQPEPGPPPQAGGLRVAPRHGGTDRGRAQGQRGGEWGTAWFRMAGRVSPPLRHGSIPLLCSCGVHMCVW